MKRKKEGRALHCSNEAPEAFSVCLLGPAHWEHPTVLGSPIWGLGALTGRGCGFSLPALACAPPSGPPLGRCEPYCCCGRPPWSWPCRELCDWCEPQQTSLARRPVGGGLHRGGRAAGAPLRPEQVEPASNDPFHSHATWAVRACKQVVAELNYFLGVETGQTTGTKSQLNLASLPRPAAPEQEITLLFPNTHCPLAGQDIQGAVQLLGHVEVMWQAGSTHGL